MLGKLSISFSAWLCRPGKVLLSYLQASGMWAGCMIVWLMCLPSVVAAQQCTGSLGDPIFKETFGSAGTTVKPTLGLPLAAGTTTYTYYSPATVSRPVGPYPGQYTISNTTRGYNNTYFVDRPDHTSGNGTGYCMVVDANATPDQFYQRTITGLCAGTTFEFSAWIMNINPQNGVSKPSLRFDIMDANNPNGAPLASVSTGQVNYQSPGTWIRQAGVFNMPSTTNSVILKIFSNTPSSNGNDLALDDIAFAACGPPITFTQATGTVCKGGNTSLSVSLPAGSYSSYFFQLQRRLLGAADWTDVGGIINNGANNQYTFNITNAEGGYEYRVVAAGGQTEINNLNCRVTSTPVELKVIDFSVAVNGTQPVCYNQTATLTATLNPVGTGTPTTGITYTWESSANGTSGWTAVAGQTSATLTTTPLTANRYYRVTATVNGCSGNGVSQSFLVNVNPLISLTLTNPASICQGTTTVNVPYTILSGNADRYSITSTDMPGFVPVTNAVLGTSPIAVNIPANAPPGTYQFRVVFSNNATACPSDIFGFTVVVDAPPTTANAGPAQNLCGVATTTLGANAPAIGTGTWTQVSGPTTALFADIHNPVSAVSDLQPGAYIFRWTIANGACGVSTSTVQVNITPAPTLAFAGLDQTQYNSGLFVMNANTPVTGTGTWTVVNGTANVANNTNPTTSVTLAPNTSATLVWTITNGICPPSTDTVILTYTSTADIRILKEALELGPYISGQDFIYRITVTNAGPSNATNVRVTDPLPAGFVPGTASYNVTGGAQILQNNSTAANVDLTANIPTSAGSSVVITLTGKIASSFDGDLTNTATAVSPDVPDPDGATSTVTISTVRKPFFQAVKSAPSSTIAGNTIAFGVVVNNTGLSDALNTLITDQVSNKLTNVSWTATATGKVNIVSGATGTGNNVQLRANMPGGDTGKIYIRIVGTVSAAATGNIVNVANVAPSEVTTSSSSSNTTLTLITSSPGLVIDKSHTGSAIVTSGQRINYVIALMNNGPSNAVNTVIADTVPATIQNVTWTTSVQGSAVVTAGATGNGNIIRVTGDVPAGSSNMITVTASGTVDSDFSGNIINYSTATPSEPGVPPVRDLDVATAQKSLALAVVKRGPATAIAGSPLSYSIDVTNNGPSNSTATLIKDNVPVALTNVSWTATIITGAGNITGGATGTGNAVEVTANLNAGSICRIIINGTIEPSATGTIQNSATVTPSEPNIGGITSNVVTTTLTKNAALTITKTAADTIGAGSVISYRIVVRNNGPSNVTGAVITDVVPASIQNVTWIATTEGNAAITASGTGAGSNVSVTGNLVAGAANMIIVTVKGTINPSFNGTISNTAVVTPPAGAGTGDTATKVTVVNRLPQLAIAKEANNFVQAGENITYKITVSNISNADARNLVVTDVVPATLTNVSWQAVTTGAASITNGTNGTGNNVSLTGSIPAGADNEIIITVTGTTPSSLDGNISNTAIATPAEPVPPVSATKEVRVRRIPTLTITKSGPSTAAAGSQISYKIVVTNTSTADAQGLGINDLVPVPVQQVTWTATGNNGAIIVSGATGTGNNVDVDANIPGGRNANVTIIVTGIIDPSFSGTFQNGASFQPLEPGAIPGAALPVITTVTKQTAVRITKSGPSIANSGNMITYTLIASNLGPSNAGTAVITDQIPALLTNVSWTATASGGATIDNGATGTGNALRVTADIPATTGRVTVTVTGTIPANITATTINNFGIITPSEAGSAAMNSDTVVTVIRSQPGLQITKVGPATARAGDPISYNIKVVNVGPSDAKNVNITDAVPAVSLNAAWTATANGNSVLSSGTSGTGNQVNIIADIPVGEQNAVNIVVTGVLKGDFAGNVDNVAIATPSEPGTTPVTSHVRTVVDRQVKLQISKAGPAEISAGSIIRYDIDVTNAGPGDATNMTIRDNIPAGINNATWTATAVNGAIINSGNTGTGNILLNANIPNTPLASIHITITGTVDAAFGSPSINNTAIVTNDPAVFVNGDTSSVTTLVNRVANLRIIKSGPANRAAGESIQYILRVQNNGPSAAIGAIVQDVIPASILNATWTTTVIGNVTNVSAMSGTGNVNLTADVPADPNAYLIVTINGVVSPAVVNGATVLNTGTVSLPPGSPITDPYPLDNTSSVSTVIDNDPVVRISKSGPAVSNIGDTLVYRITVSNGGSGDITNAVIEDQVPASVEVMQWQVTALGNATITGPASGTTNTIQTAGNIPVGTENPSAIFILVQGRVLNTAGTTIVNTATVTAGSNKQSTVTTAVNNATDIRLVKSGPQTILAGEPISYTIQVFNDGPRDADQLEITDIIPPAITNVTWKAAVTGNGSVLDSMVIDSSGNINLPAKLAAARNNFITITISGVVNGNTPAGTITNTGTVIASGLIDYNPANNTSSVATVVGRATGVRIHKSGPSQANAGNGITYQVVVNNDGPSTATGVAIADLVPATVQGVQWNVSVTGGATVTGPFSGNTNSVATTADIPAGTGNSVIVTVTGTLNNDFNGSVKNVASASGAGIPEVKDSVNTQVVAQTAVAIQKDGPATVTAGAPLTYTITATNNGPAYARGLVITDTLDVRLQNAVWTVSALNGASITSGAAGNGPFLSVTADIPPTGNASVLVTVTGTVAAGASGTIINRATLTPSLAVNPPVVSPPVTTQILQRPQLTILKSGPARSGAGAAINYLLQINNKGLSNAANAQISDLVPATVKQVSWNVQSVSGGTIVQSGNTGTGNNVAIVADIPAGAGMLVAVSGTLDSAFEGTVSNKAVIRPSEPGVSADSSTISTIVVLSPVLQITKSGPAILRAGDRISYTIVAHNAGPSLARNAAIQDAVPTAISQVTWGAIVSGNAKINGAGSGTGNIIALNADLPTGANDNVTIAVSGLVASSFRDTIRNFAAIYPSETNGKADTSETVQTVVVAQPILNINKTGPATAIAGDRIVYNITVSNAGISDAINASINDQVPVVITDVRWQASTTGTASVAGPFSGSGNNIGLIGSIPAGVNNTIQITVSGRLPGNTTGTITNEAIVTPAETGAAAARSSTTTTVTASSDIQILKIGPSLMFRGQDAEYDITLVNLGPSDAKGVVITDLIPAVLQNVVWRTTSSKNTTIISGVQGNGNNVRVVADIPADTSGLTIRVFGDVDLNAPAGDVFNTAHASANGIDHPSQEVISTIVSSTDLSISKTATPQVYVGSQVTYLLDAVNRGFANANNAVIEDVIPAGITNPQVTVLSAVNGAGNIQTSIINNKLTATLGNFPVRGELVLQITGTATQVGTITNTAVINTPPGVSETNLPDNTSSASTQVLPKVPLTITKTIDPATGPYGIGQKVTYTLSATNAGNAGVNPVVVTDTLPAANLLGDPTYAAPPRGTVTFDANNRLLQWNAGLLNPGETLKWSYDAVIKATGTIRNTAAIAGPPTVSTGDTSGVTILATGTDLSIVKAGPDTVFQGANLTYSLTVRNLGPDAANGAVVLDTLPSNITQPVISVTTASGGAANVQTAVTNGIARATIGTFPAGAQVVLQITGMAGQVGTVNNTAVVNTPTGLTDIDSSNNRSNTVSTVIIPKAPLDINKTVTPAGGPFTVGQTITYTLTAANRGQAAVPNVVVTDTLPSAQLLSDPVYNNPPKGTITYNSSNRVLQWNIGTLAAGENVSWNYNATIKGTGDIRNIAIVTGPPDITVPDTSVVPIVVASTDLSIVKAGPDTVFQGAEVAYSLTIKNLGPDAANGAVVLDTLPSNITQPVISVTTAGGGAANVQTAVTNGIASATIGTFPAGAQVVLQIAGVASQVGTVSNTAVVNTPAGLTDIDSSNNRSNTVTTVIIPKAPLDINKTVTPATGPFTLGQTISYTLTAANRGQAAVPNVVVTDTLPSAQLLSDPVYNNPPKGTITYNSSNRVLQWNIGTLAAGENVSWNYDATIKGTGDIRNIAIVTGPPDITVPDTSVVPIVVASTDLSIVKAGPDTVFQGAKVAYSLTIKNLGPDAANGSIVLDTLPSNITQPVISVTTASGGAANVQTAVTNGIARATIGAFPAGAQVVLQIAGVASQVGTVNNTAVVNTPTGLTDIDSSNNRSNTVATVIIPKAPLDINKTVTPAGGPFTLGQTITYTLTAANRGQAAVPNVVVTDTLPSAQLLSDPVYNNPPKGTITYNSSNRVLQWNIGTLAAGENVSWNYNATIKGTGDIRNIAIVTGPPDITVPDTSVVPIVVASTDLAITKTGPANAVLNGDVTYRITVTNKGPDVANNATVLDTISNTLTRSQITVISTTGGAANVSTSKTGDIYKAVIGNFPAGAVVVLEISGTASQTGTIRNSAVVNTPTGVPDLDSSNNRSAVVITEVTDKVKLVIHKTVNPATGPYKIGQQLTYTLTATNPGTVTIDPVVVTDELPPASQVSDPVYNTPSKGTVAYDNAGRKLEWKVGALNAGETANWSYSVTIKGAGAIKNIAVVTGPPDVTTPGTDSVIVTTDKYANLKIDKKLTTALPLNVGQVLQFAITVINNGPDSATNVVVKDPLEAKLTGATNIITTKGVGAYDVPTQGILWTIPAMAPGAQETLTFSVKLMSGGTITNTATVAGKEIDPDLSDNTITITQDVTGEDIIIPNTVTPNGDGKNDHFKIPGIERYPGSVLDIYNRWGNQVYHSNNYDNTWDGRDLNEGTYFYTLKLRTPQGERQFKGWILLVR